MKATTICSSAIGLLAVKSISFAANARGSMTANASIIGWFPKSTSCFYEWFGGIVAVNNAPAHANQCNDFSTQVSSVPIITPLNRGETTWGEFSIGWTVSGANVGPLQAPITCRAYSFSFGGSYYQSSPTSSNGAGPSYQYIYKEHVTNLGLLESLCYLGSGGEGIVGMEYGQQP